MKLEYIIDKGDITIDDGGMAVILYANPIIDGVEQTSSNGTHIRLHSWDDDNGEEEHVQHKELMELMGAPPMNLTDLDDTMKVKNQMEAAIRAGKGLKITVETMDE